MIVIFLALSILIAYFIGSNLANPVIKISESALKIAQLDIRDDMDTKICTRRDEVGKLGKALQDITLSLRSIMTDINLSSELVTASSEELTATSQITSKSIEEVAKAINEIACSASNQAKNVEDGVHKSALLGLTIENDQKEMQALNMNTSKVTDLVKEGLDEIDNLTKISIESTNATALYAKVS